MTGLVVAGPDGVYACVAADVAGTTASGPLRAQTGAYRLWPTAAPGATVAATVFITERSLSDAELGWLAGGGVAGLGREAPVLGALTPPSTWWRSVANAAGSALPAVRGAWRRARHC